MYRFRCMPKRGTYVLARANSSWFSKGSEPWNKGKAMVRPKGIGKGVRRSASTEFRKGQNIGERNVNWKGDQVGYMAVHSWVHRNFGKADVCEECGSKNNVEWANISHEYKREREDWKKLCKKHHIRFDRTEGWGAATKKFNLRKI